MEIGGRDWLAGCSVYDQMVLAVADEQGTCARSEGWGAGLEQAWKPPGRRPTPNEEQIQRAFSGFC